MARTLEVLSNGFDRELRVLSAEKRILQSNAIALESVISALRERIPVPNETGTVHAENRVAAGTWSGGDISSLRVMGIMDEFTASAFKVGCILHQPNLLNWQSEAVAFAPDILIIESAWQGNGGQWHQKIDRMNSELRAIVDWCRERRIPTVFWNKEDPVHYNGFISVATLFDYVFTTDIESIRRYKRELDHDRVYLMPFFCEPELHNPLDAERAPGFSFAGAYYRRYSERQADFDALMSGVEGLGQVAIYDRNYDNSAPEFEFPASYKDLIRGGLNYSEIDRSYKGYEFGINMNSVKQSQSMFARRVFDLILCGTHVVSNYSRGLRLLFGDLVVSSDSASRIRDRVKELLGGEGDSRKNPYAAYIRLLALRKVLDEHTTQDRLAYMASRIWVDAPLRNRPMVAVVAQPAGPDELSSILDQFKRQTWAHKELVLLIDENTSMPLPAQTNGVRYSVRSRENVDLALLTDAPYVTIWQAGASYGSHYLQDAVRSFEFGNVDAVARVPVSEDALGLSNAFQPIKSAPISSTVWRLEAMPVVKLNHFADAISLGRISGLRIMTLPSFDYAPPLEALVDTQQWDSVTDLGIQISSLLRTAELAEQEQAPARVESGWTTERLKCEFPQSGRPRDVQVTHTADSFNVISNLAAGEHKYVYAANQVPITEFVGDGSMGWVHVVARPGLALSLVVLFLDSEGGRVGSQVAPVNSNISIPVPDSTKSVHFALRVQGPGATEVHAVSFAPIESKASATGLLSDKPQLLVTNVYPSYKDLYRNGFVHSRVRTYREAGLRTSVFVLNPRSTPGTYEFEGVEVQVGGEDELAATLRGNSFKNVLVHFLDRQMWGVLNGFVEHIPVTVWIHGAEIQPWYRRDFNYANESERESAKVASSARMALWEDVFSCSHPNLHFVLVSRYFAEEVMSDVGIRLRPEKYSVIHNFVDTELFKYREKSPDQRLRVLSIRPFASRKYANDLTVQTILALREHPKFSSAHFLIVGDGVLFDEVLEPLKGLANVEVRREFLAQREIANLHKDFGIFMSPTRMDSQGVSRDEAMSSGLVPVTTAVTAIPEFVDPSCGVLAPAEDAGAMASGLAALWDDADAFKGMSAAAARRVAQQSGREQTIQAEISLIFARSRK